MTPQLTLQQFATAWVNAGLMAPTTGKPMPEELRRFLQQFAPEGTVVVGAINNEVHFEGPGRKGYVTLIPGATITL